MKAVTFSETLVKTYRITLCATAEDHIVIACKCEYLRAHHIREIVLLAHSSLCSWDRCVK